MAYVEYSGLVGSQRRPHAPEHLIHPRAIASVDQKIDVPHRSRRPRGIDECRQRRALQDDDRYVGVREPAEGGTEDLALGDAVNRVSMVEVSQAFRDRPRHSAGSRGELQARVGERCKAPALDLPQDRLPVGTTLRQLLDAVNVGVRPRAGEDQGVFEGERHPHAMLITLPEDSLVAMSLKLALFLSRNLHLEKSNMRRTTCIPRSYPEAGLTQSCICVSPALA